jgi:hypothetical protein
MPQTIDQTDGDMPMPEINTDKVCFVIAKAGELEAEDEGISADDSNPTDDESTYILTEEAYGPISLELTAFIDSLDEDEQAELVSLVWIGRGDYSARELRIAIAEAKARKEMKTSSYLRGIPLLSDYLKAGLAEFGLDCEDFNSRSFR